MDALAARSVELKRELLEFSQLSRFDRAFQEATAAAGLGPVVTDEQRLTMVIDHFLLQFRLRNGRTVVEQFVAARSDLPDAEREMLLGWRDVVEGIFEVQRRDGVALVVENLIDELTYRVRSNTGTAVFRQMPRRSYVVTRLVPVGDEWLISGATSVFPARYHAELHRAAAEQAMRSPSWASGTRTSSRGPGSCSARIATGSSASSVRTWSCCAGRRSRTGCARSGSSVTGRSRQM